MIRPKPHYIYGPNPMRLPKRKAVTIAIGLSCHQGIILATDSQETISYLKQDVGKLRTVLTSDCIVSFAEAGDTDYINTAIECATRDIHKARDFLSVINSLEDKFLEFFGKHILPWSSFPAKDRPEVELLMGITMRGKRGGQGLYHYSGTAFHRVSSHSIGAGMLVADDLISHYCFGNHTIPELVKLAVFVLSKAKRQVDGCGGVTNILTIRSGDFTLCENKEIEAMEEELKKKEKESISQLKKEILSLPEPTLKWMTEYKKKN
jgi:20S proteasome alpha/beta subunit